MFRSCSLSWTEVAMIENSKDCTPECGWGSSPQELAWAVGRKSALRAGSSPHNPTQAPLTGSSHRERVSGVGFGNVVHAEIAAEDGPGCAGGGGIGGGGPVVHGHDKVGENGRLIKRLAGLRNIRAV